MPQNCKRHTYTEREWEPPYATVKDKYFSVHTYDDRAQCKKQKLMPQNSKRQTNIEWGREQPYAIS